MRGIRVNVEERVTRPPASREKNRAAKKPGNPRAAIEGQSE
jgi:hypothetical protein